MLSPSSMDAGKLHLNLEPYSKTSMLTIILQS
jgi:hypothetical protein